MEVLDITRDNIFNRYFLGMPGHTIAWVKVWSLVLKSIILSAPLNIASGASDKMLKRDRGMDAMRLMSGV